MTTGVQEVAKTHVITHMCMHISKINLMLFALSDFCYALSNFATVLQGLEVAKFLTEI